MLGTPASSQDAEELRFEAVCDWINDVEDAAELATIIGRLEATDDECIFDPDTGRNYCTVCLSLAGARLAELIVPAEGPELQAQ